MNGIRIENLIKLNHAKQLVFAYLMGLRTYPTCVHFSSRHNVDLTHWNTVIQIIQECIFSTNAHAVEELNNNLEESIELIPDTAVNQSSAAFSEVKNGFGTFTNETVETSPISQGDANRIKNAATRIKKDITVVGSRAKGTAKAGSDWDYVIEGMTNKDFKKNKNSLPGAKSSIDNTQRFYDIFKTPVMNDLPNIKFTSQK